MNGSRRLYQISTKQYLEELSARNERRALCGLNKYTNVKPSEQKGTAGQRREQRQREQKTT